MTRIITLAVLGLTAAAPAFAACPDNMVDPAYPAAIPDGAELVEVEGKVATIGSDYIIVNGTCISIPAPATFSVDTAGGGTRPFSTLQGAPNGTMIVLATATLREVVEPSVGTSLGRSLDITADQVYYEIAENVIAGSLTQVVDNQTIVVGGTTVELLADNTFFDTSVLDLGGNDIGDFSLLTNHLGSLVSAEGYFDTDGTLKAIVTETEAIQPSGNPLVDTVIIERATLRVGRGEVEVRGSVSPIANGSFANSVDIYLDACSNVVFGVTTPDNTSTVTPDLALGLGEFRWRERGVGSPSSVCVKSANDGEAGRAFDLR